MESANRQRAPTQGLSVAGRKRFPAVDQVAKALNIKTTIGDSDDSIRSALIHELEHMVANSGEFSTVRGSTISLPTLRLTSALRKLTVHERNGRPIKTSRARALLKLDPGSLNIIVLGMQGTKHPFEVTLRPDNKPIEQSGSMFAWVVVLCSPDVRLQILNTTGKLSASDLPLPRLDDVRYQTYFGEGGRQAQLNTEIAIYNEKWIPNYASTYAVICARSILYNVAIQLVPTKEVKLELFGSRLYKVCKSDSDIDFSMSVDLSDIGPESVLRRFCHQLANALRMVREFVQVVWIPSARVPIIKFVFRHKGIDYEGDISFNNGIGPEKSRLIKTYLSMDPRVHLFIMLLKHWAVSRAISSSSVLNSFGLMMMGIAFLIDQRVIPPLQLLSTVNIGNSTWNALNKILDSPPYVAYFYNDVGTPYCINTGRDLPKNFVDGHYTYYFNNPTLLRTWRSTNTMTTLELLYEMFRFYGSEFDPLYYGISPRLGAKSIEREFLQKLDAPPPSRFIRKPQSWRNNLRLLAIEDPFEVSVNCGRNAPAEWVIGLFWEMRRAAYFLNDALISENYNILNGLFAPPKLNIYADAKIWTSVYRELLLRLGRLPNDVLMDNDELQAKLTFRNREF